MNKNTKRRQSAIRESGAKFMGYKKKAKPFPTPNKDEDMSLATQRRIFNGSRWTSGHSAKVFGHKPLG